MTLECKICRQALPDNFVGFVNHFRNKHPELPEVQRLQHELEDET